LTSPDNISFRDYGLADKKAAVEQLARRFSFIDIDKVGIWGHSGGGFMSAAAMLVYPDFFKVAWSESGNHENNIYNAPWSEKNYGIKEVKDAKGNITFEYTMDKNSELAKNLKGRLMLTTGDYDNNVHPANTMRLADALIKANKRFDMMIFPGKRTHTAPSRDMSAGSGRTISASGCSETSRAASISWNWPENRHRTGEARRSKVAEAEAGGATDS